MGLRQSGVLLARSAFDPGISWVAGSTQSSGLAEGARAPCRLVCGSTGRAGVSRRSGLKYSTLSFTARANGYACSSRIRFSASTRPGRLRVIVSHRMS